MKISYNLNGFVFLSNTIIHTLCRVSENIEKNKEENKAHPVPILFLGLELGSMRTMVCSFRGLELPVNLSEPIAFWGRW